METPSARGIIIFANEDDIRWDGWHVPSPCLPEALLQGPASSFTCPPPPRTAFLFFSLSHPTHFSSCHLCLVPPPQNEPGLVWAEIRQAYSRELHKNWCLFLEFKVGERDMGRSRCRKK